MSEDTHARPRDPGEPIAGTREYITIGPFGIFFSNKNEEMQLPGHSHHATVTMRFRTRGRFGFPAFADTYAELQEQLVGLTAAPFRNATNEEVARRLYEQVGASLQADREAGADTAIVRRGGEYELVSLALNVRGTLDRIGHADGWTEYVVQREQAPLPPRVARDAQERYIPGSA